MKNEQKKPALIGVIGGVGPFAGLDFMRNIFNSTRAAKDQEHLDCVLVSCPSIIPDRTEFLFNSEAAENPCMGMFESAKKLHAAGVSYAVVACNTAHSGRIFGPFCEMARDSLPGLTIINMLETCATHVRKNMGITRIGLLATLGTHRSGVYREYFGGSFELIEPDAAGQKNVHEAIYSKEFGIKAFSQPVTPLARETIGGEIRKLASRGAQAIILGCTELPLAVQAGAVSVPVIDPGLIAARALVARAAPEKLLAL
ncbi:MAG: amino acid racemase [Treponema sp.]|nr:amino acid racemase [Treponema sp.]